MSDEKHEKIADIVAEMRECDGHRAYYDGGLHHESGDESVVDVDYLNDFADRIEAAWKREKAETEADALNVGAVVATTEKSSAVGNAAAMREALKKLDKWLYIGADGFVHGMHDKTDEIERTIKDAISEPPRNCDVGTAEEQQERYLKLKREHVDRMARCPAVGQSFFPDSLHWAQMPYDGGGTDDNQCILSQRQEEMQ